MNMTVKENVLDFTSRYGNIADRLTTYLRSFLMSMVSKED